VKSLPKPCCIKGHKSRSVLSTAKKSSLATPGPSSLATPRLTRGTSTSQVAPPG
jgi:hypothetical protein